MAFILPLDRKYNCAKMQNLHGYHYSTDNTLFLFTDCSSPESNVGMSQLVHDPLQRNEHSKLGTRQSIFDKAAVVVSTSRLAVAMIYVEQRLWYLVKVTKDREITAVQYLPFPIIEFQLSFRVHPDHYLEVRLQRMILS